MISMKVDVSIYFKLWISYSTISIANKINVVSGNSKVPSLQTPAGFITSSASNDTRTWVGQYDGDMLQRLGLYLSATSQRPALLI